MAYTIAEIINVPGFGTIVRASDKEQSTKAVLDAVAEKGLAYRGQEQDKAALGDKFFVKLESEKKFSPLPIECTNRSRAGQYHEFTYKGAKLTLNYDDTRGELQIGSQPPIHFNQKGKDLLAQYSHPDLFAKRAAELSKEIDLGTSGNYKHKAVERDVLWCVAKP